MQSRDNINSNRHSYAKQDILINEKLPERHIKEIREIIDAANNGDANSQYRLAKLFFEGYGIPKDISMGLELIEKAAAQGHIEAAYELGCFYYNGENVKKSYKEAAKYFTIVAEKADKDSAQYTTALYTLGTLYYTGSGVTKDIDKASTYFSDAAKTGHSTSLMTLNKIARADNCLKAKVLLGFIYEDGKNVKKDIDVAISLFMDAAEQGYLFGQTCLARIYHYGHGPNNKYQDLTKAIYWYTKAAEQGHRSSQYKLGEFYYKGIGVEKNPTEAFKWFKKAAEQGDGNAQFYMGKMYYTGEGTRKNIASAIKWVTKSLGQNTSDISSSEINFFLGKMLWERRKDQDDLKNAVQLLLRARKEYNQDAMDFVKKNLLEIKEIIDKIKKNS